MTASMAAFTCNDAFFKLANDNLPFFQALFLRSLAVTVLMLGLAHVQGALIVRLNGRDRALVALRTIAEMAAAYFFLTALVHMPIANVTAIIQALPLTITLGAALVLREPVGWRRLLAITIGLVGVLIIIRPGGAGFNTYAVYAVLAVVCVTIRDLAARRISAEVPSLYVAFVAVIGVLALSAAGCLLTPWAAVTAREAGLLAGSSAFILVAYLTSVMAMRVGEVGVVSQFRYTSLLIALILGLLVFGEWPDSLTLLGATIVVATGLFTLWRERHQG